MTNEITQLVYSRSGGRLHGGVAGCWWGRSVSAASCIRYLSANGARCARCGTGAGGHLRPITGYSALVLLSRGTALASRGAALMSRRAALPNRGASLSCRGAVLADTEATLASRGAALHSGGLAPASAETMPVVRFAEPDGGEGRLEAAPPCVNTAPSCRGVRGSGPRARAQSPGSSRLIPVALVPVAVTSRPSGRSSRTWIDRCGRSRSPSVAMIRTRTVSPVRRAA
jgi:hypothetical protein